MIVTKVTLNSMTFMQSHEDAIALSSLIDLALAKCTAEELNEIALQTGKQYDLNIGGADSVAAAMSYVRHVSRSVDALKSYVEALRAASKQEESPGDPFGELGGGSVQ